jgi:hypothetical protein
MRWPIALVAIAGCGGAQAVPENPAHIVHATPESRQALERAVAQALDVSRVTLEPDALTLDSSLTIGLGQINDPRTMLRGHDPEAPGPSERFHLVKIGEHCVLVRDRDNHHYDLIGTDCDPM